MDSSVFYLLFLTAGSRIPPSGSLSGQTKTSESKDSSVPRAGIKDLHVHMRPGGNKGFTCSYASGPDQRIKNNGLRPNNSLKPLLSLNWGVSEGWCISLNRVVSLPAPSPAERDLNFCARLGDSFSSFPSFPSFPYFPYFPSFRFSSMCFRNSGP